MQGISTFYDNVRTCMQTQVPVDWSYQAVKDTRAAFKTAQEAHKFFSRLSLAGVLLGAFTIKFITGALWLPTLLFAGITAVAFFALSIYFGNLVKKFESWRDLSNEQVQNIIYEPYHKAIKSSPTIEKFITDCEAIKATFNDNKLSLTPAFSEPLAIYYLTLNANLNPQQKMELLLMANQRHLILIFPPLKVPERGSFILEYVEYIFKNIKSEKDLKPVILFQQFRLLNRLNAGQDCVRLGDDKKHIFFIANCFLSEELIETCKLLSTKMKVSIILHPMEDREKIPFQRLAATQQNIALKFLKPADLPFKLLDETAKGSSIIL